MGSRKKKKARSEAIARGSSPNARVVMTCVPGEMVRAQREAEGGEGGDSAQRTAHGTRQDPVTVALGAFTATPSNLVLMATADPFDRAHGIHLGEGLMPAATEIRGRRNTGGTIGGVSQERRVLATLNGQARAREYPSCYMTGGGAGQGGAVSFETANDELYERQRWLASQGLEVGGVGNAESRAWGTLAALGLMGNVAVRDLVVRPRLKVRDEATGKLVRDADSREGVMADLGRRC